MLENILNENLSFLSTLQKLLFLSICCDNCLFQLGYFFLLFSLCDIILGNFLG